MFRTIIRALAGLFVACSSLAPQTGQAAVGRTIGDLQVTRNGDALYVVDFEMPRGIGAVQPTLALSLSSSPESGVAGFGARILGFSAISRCLRSLAADGIAASIELDDTDAFCWDGRKLKLASGVSGQDGAVYRTEIETISKVVARVSGGSGWLPSSGPAWFEVWLKNGLILELGATDDSRIAANGSSVAVTWAISRMRDRAGNYAAYSYVKDTANGSYRPSEIAYAGNASLNVAPSHKVVFSYVDRSAGDPLNAYFAGGLVKQTKRLSYVEIQYSDPTLATFRRIKRYQLGVTQSAVTGRTLVSSITECAASDSDCLAPTQFTYQGTQSGWTASETSTGTSAVDPLNVHSIDINGDGRGDVLFLNGSTWAYMLGQANGTMGPVATSSISSTGVGMPGDFDGDGVQELWTSSGGNAVLVRWDGSGLAAVTVPGVMWGERSGRAADVNGDGRDDLVTAKTCVYPGPTRFPCIEVFLSTGTSFVTDTTTNTTLEQGNLLGPTFGDNRYRYQSDHGALDFNNDGLADLLLGRATAISGGTVNWHLLLRLRTGGFSSLVLFATANDSDGVVVPKVGDFNGDRITDIAYRGSDGIWKLRFGSGAGYLSGTGISAEISTGVGVTAYADSLAVDADGDGRTDIVAPIGGNWHVAKSTGETLAGFASTGLPATNPTAAKLLDVNGDTGMDLLYATSGVLNFRTHLGPNSDRLSSAADGFGIAATLAYAPLSDTSVYTKYTDAVFPTRDVVLPKRVIRQTTLSDGLGGTYNISYTYAGGKGDAQGRGFSGFAVRRIVDSRNGITREEEYRTDFPYVGLMKGSTTRQSSGGTVIQSVVDTHASWSYGSGSRYLPYVTKRVISSYEAAGPSNGAHVSTVTVDDSVDAFGTVFDSTTTTAEMSTGIFPGATVTERTRLVTRLNDEANWCLGRPTELQQINSHSMAGGTQLTRVKSYTWNAVSCQPAQEIVEPGDSQWQVTTDYSYDSLGNVHSVVTTPAAASGQSARITTINWQPSGRFLQSIVNAKFQRTSFEWDGALGLPAQLTDPNGRETRRQYDSFGRQTREEWPDGTATDYVLSACNASNSYCNSSATDLRSSLQIIARDTANDAVRTDSQYFDAFDRPRYVYQQILGGGNSGTITQYDVLGRVSSESMPFTSGDPTSYTTYAYDLLDRPTSMQRQTSEVDTSSSTWQIAHQGLTTVITDPLGHSTTTVGDAAGRIVHAIDAIGADTDYEYDAFGNLLETRDFQGNESRLTYNVRGMKLSSSDPDMGNWTYDYFPLGELKKQTDARGQEVTFSYDALSRPVLRHEPEGDTTWYWDTAANGIGQLDYVTSPGGYVERYFFDNSGRPYQSDITADGATYSYNTTYDSAGLAETLTYPVSTGGVRFKVRYGYQYGLMQQVRDYTGNVLGTTFWQANAANARNQVLDTQLGNGVRTIDSYDRITGQLDSRTSGPAGDTTIQNLAYDYNKAGWLTQRQDLRQNLTEAFNYDTLGRMTSSTLNGVQNLNLTYDAIGNILTKSNVTAATWTYDTVKKHAVKTAGSYTFSYDANGNMISDGTGGTTSWYSYNLPNLIQSPSTVGAVSSQILYGHARQRYKQTAAAGSISETTIYIGGLLRKVTFSGTTSWKHAITTDTGIVAYHTRQSSGSNDTQYFTKDHLGSIDSITNAAGGLLVRMSFDAFGKRRKEAGWSGNVPTADETAITSTNRDGYTGHEMLDSIGMVHMNGRVYYPKIGRFLSPDPYVQAPYNSQSLNRYSYVFNNPLSYTDSSGFNSQRSVDGADGPDSLGSDLYSLFSRYNFLGSRANVNRVAREGPSPSRPMQPHSMDASDGMSTVGGINDGILPSFGRGFLGTYRSVVDGPAPWSELLGRSTRQTLNDLTTVASIGLMAVPGGQASGAGAIAGSIRNVNPLRSLTNCVNCAIATDATLAGRAASALASGPTSISLLESLYGSQFSRVGGQQAIEALLIDAGSGARGIVYGSRGTGEVGHVFNAVNQNGTIRFLDGQIGGAASFEGYVELFFLRTF